MCIVQSQPKGEELGAASIVALDILLEETGKILIVPCYICPRIIKASLTGIERNCGVILETNATMEKGVQVVHAS